MPSDTNTSMEQTTMQQAANPAPVEGFENQVMRRLADFESFMGRVHDFMNNAGPTLAKVEELASAVVPGAAPVVAAVTELQSLFGDLISSLDNHFGAGKIGLPPAPTQSAG